MYVCVCVCVWGEDVTYVIHVRKCMQSSNDKINVNLIGSLKSCACNPSVTVTLNNHIQSNHPAPPAAWNTEKLAGAGDDARQAQWSCTCTELQWAFLVLLTDLTQMVHLFLSGFNQQPVVQLVMLASFSTMPRLISQWARIQYTSYHLNSDRCFPKSLRQCIYLFSGQ